MKPSGAGPSGPHLTVAVPSKRSRLLGARTALGFLAPMLALYAIYYVYAFVFLAKTSTQDVDLSFSDPEQVGGRNFVLVLTDPIFWRAMFNTLLFAGFGILIALTLGFFLAVALSSGIRLRRWFYVIFLMPSLVPLALFATLFSQMLQTDGGAINGFLSALGLGAFQQDWLGNEYSAYAAIFMLLVFLVGIPIMYYTSALSTVSASVLEAAMLDGAKTLQMYRLILFPILRATHKSVILWVLLGSFRAFEIVYFTTAGEPAGRTDITGTYIYGYMFPSIGGGQIGYASAAAVVTLVAAIGVAAINLRFHRSDR